MRLQHPTFSEIHAAEQPQRLPLTPLGHPRRLHRDADPQLRSGSYFPEFLQPRRRAERALAAVVQAYVQGISTRSVEDQVQALGMTGISKSEVRRLCAEVDEEVQAFQSRPFESDWPYLWIDAPYVKTREAGRMLAAPEILTAESTKSHLGPMWRRY